MSRTRNCLSCRRVRILSLYDIKLISQDTKISKRHLTRPPIAAISSSKQQIIYVSSRTPFMSAIARIRKHIAAIQKRRSQSVHATAMKRKSGPLTAAKGDRILAVAIESLDRQDNAAKGGQTDEIFVKGTGKAVEMVLDIAGWLQEHTQREGVRVRLETGSWWAVDDVEIADDEEGTLNGNEDAMEVEERQQEEVPESRLRSVSVLTVRVEVL
jgi:ribonuclease P/MRP protein subunit POP7